jgi:hypothetical protein
VTAQQNEPGGAGRDAPLTASGLDESQIDAADLKALRGSVRLRSLPLDMAVATTKLAAWECALPSGSLRSIEPGCATPRKFALRIVPLPHKAVIRRLAQQTPSARLMRDLPLALRQPVRRRRIRPDDLPEAMLKTLFTKLFEKYGEQARQMEITAVFPHVPPEAAGAITVDPALAWAAFELPAGVAPGKARAGFYLIVLSAPEGETRKVLLRL